MIETLENMLAISDMQLSLDPVVIGLFPGDADRMGAREEG